MRSPLRSAPLNLMRCVGGAFTGLTLALLTSPAAAQNSGATAREVVQPLPTAEVQRLNRALRQLARRPRDLGVLVEAGNAAMVLGDYDAAIGFFGRAQDISPNEPRVKMGMAAVFLRSDRPIEALRLFSEAEAAGASSRDVLPDRGLAFDLVGNNARAQETYRRALVLKDDNEVTRRLALSQAITGDSDGFEETLRPLLEERDFAAFRTQAFGLAILGRQDEAAAIADAVMPRDLAARMTPFLAFMPRLTKAQQAAAANLGIFPAAADVGRDDPRIAQYAAQGNAIARAADDRLAPSGEPLGRPSGERGSSGGDEDATPTEPKASVADAFAEFGEGAPRAVPGGKGAVDLAAIEIPREDETQPEPEVQKPAHPSRQWVQVATGRDRSALRFDWRRFARTAPDQLGDLSPHVVRWGESNRLLAGPLPNAGEARAMVNALREKGLDSFTYTSPEGQEIQELK